MSELLYLAHHGVKGQKHGVRQWQNKDGSLTPAGRIHYGVGAAKSAVGKAAKSVGKAIRKKVKPTNVELNAQIRKEQSKILNKQKREELKRLKKTGELEAPKKKFGHKKYSEMTDEEVNSRITRLKKEAELAELEFTKDLGPGKRMVLNAVKEGTAKGISVATQTLITKAGKEFSDYLFKDDKSDNKKDDSSSPEINVKPFKKKEAKAKTSSKAPKTSKKNTNKKDNVKIRLVSDGREDERFWNKAKKTVGSVKFRKKSSSQASSTALAIRK